MDERGIFCPRDGMPYRYHRQFVRDGDAVFTAPADAQPAVWREREGYPKTGIMLKKTDPMFPFMLELAKAADLLVPEHAEAAEEFWRLMETAYQQDQGGRLTREASEARRRLSNPEMNSTPMARAVPAKRASWLKMSKTASQSTAKALQDIALTMQARLELDTFDNAPSLPENRKASPPFSHKDEDTQFFIDWLEEEGIPPYVLRRMARYQRSFIARLMLDARHDARCEDPENAWPLLYGAGLFAKPNTTPTEDEALMLSEAFDRLVHAEDALRPQLENRLGRVLNVSESFAAGIQSILNMRQRLDDVEQQVMFAAVQNRVSMDAKVVAGIIGAGHSDLPAIEASVQAIERAGYVAARIAGDPLARCVSVMIEAINECDTRKVPVRDWPLMIANEYEWTLRQTGGWREGPKGFWALLALAMHLSQLKWKHPLPDVKSCGVFYEEEFDATKSAFNKSATRVSGHARIEIFEYDHPYGGLYSQFTEGEISPSPSQFPARMDERPATDMSNLSRVGNAVPAKAWLNYEVPSGIYVMLQMKGKSPVLPSYHHAVMMPPFVAMVDYGKLARLPSEELDRLALWDNAASEHWEYSHPWSVECEGDPEQAYRVMKLAVKRFLPNALTPMEMLEVTPLMIDHLARFWLFLVIGRMRPAALDNLWPNGFFHGVHGFDPGLGDHGYMKILRWLPGAIDDGFE